MNHTMTKCVQPLNVIDGQSVLKHSQHLPNQQPSLLSTNSSCLSSSSSTNTSCSLNSHTSSSCGSGTSPLENLPKKFVSSMRTLFDIMDDKRTGFVRLSDIEARWQDDGSKGLPHGVIDCLRRVTPVSGMLSFERFCAGLKICLLRNQANDCKMSRRSSSDSNSNSNSNSNCNLLATVKNVNSNSDTNNNTNATNGNIIQMNNQNHNVSNNHFTKNSHMQEDKKAVRIYKRSSMPVQRTLSLPKLSPSSDGDSSSDPYIMPIIPSVYAPPKPPRTGLLISANGPANLSEPKDRFDKAEIRHALQNWQMNVLMNEWEAKDKRRAMAIPNTSYINRGTADGSPDMLLNAQTYGQKMNGTPVTGTLTAPPKPIATATITAQQQNPHSNPLQATHGPIPTKPTQQIYPTSRSPTLLEFQQNSKSSNRRREIRRHTLQNGIDYNMLKRIRHLEEEKDLLLDGLHAVEKTQEWYFKQIALVQEKMKCLGRGDAHLEQWTEAHEERLDLQRARIMEVNRYLASLEESWERGGLPMHMNLAVRNHFNNGNDSTQFNERIVQINRLKLQNRQLTDEVGQKSERITALELERKSLFRELIQHQHQQQQLQQQLLRKQGHIMCGNEEVIF